MLWKPSQSCAAITHAWAQHKNILDLYEDQILSQLENICLRILVKPIRHFCMSLTALTNKITIIFKNNWQAQQMLSSYLWLFQCCRNNWMKRPSHNMFEIDWGGCNYFAQPNCISKAISSSPANIHCATGFKWQRKEAGWEDKTGLRSETVEETGWKRKLKSKKKGQDSSHGYMYIYTALYRNASEYDRYLITGLAGPV